MKKILTPSSIPHRRIASAAAIVVGAVAFSMLNRWEMTPEAWGYWFFARVFAETGTFITPDRSPLYTLYLNFFMWMGYPLSVTVQYLVSGVFAIGSMVVLFRKYFGLRIAVFAALLWIPYLLQFAEPPVQMLVLAVMCLAVVARQAGPDRRHLAMSYALLGVAVMLRPTCIIAIAIFAAWDTIKMLKWHGLRALLRGIRPRRSDWPIGIVLVLLVWFGAMQSPHRWNNVWVASNQWLLNDGKSLADSAFIQNFNVAYIQRRYGSFEGKDFYFTNQEIFGDATTMVGAIRANPTHVVLQIGENVVRLPAALMQITEFPVVFSLLRGGEEGLLLRAFLGIAFLGLSLAIIYGALRAARDESMVIFVVASVILTGITALSYVKVRWMYSMIPVLLLAAHWYGEAIRAWVVRRASTSLKQSGSTKSRRPAAPWALTVGRLAVPVFLILLSNGASSWAGVVRSVASDLSSKGEVHILEQHYLASMKGSFNAWHPLIRDCKGVMTLESTFTAAFADMPINRIYDIWEIPPFGQLGSSVYDGLKPDRVDCVLVSQALSTEVGGGSNMKIRYQHYIRPYVEQLQKAGAATHEIPHFGQVVVFK